VWQCSCTCSTERSPEPAQRSTAICLGSLRKPAWKLIRTAAGGSWLWPEEAALHPRVCEVVRIGLGTLFSNVAMFFIIVTTASTLHAHGQTQLATSADVANALRPLAGRFAMLLYTIGIVGTGLLAIPTLAGSAAYAFAETFNWRQGIDQKFTRARAFYAVVGVSIVIGVAMDFVGISAVKALYWTAVINGLLAPFLMVGILHAASDRELMCGQPSSWPGRVVVGLTTLAMFAAGVAMFVV
jgi:Mn2+/Fe2+ NRAMP family transporter